MLQTACQLTETSSQPSCPQSFKICSASLSLAVFIRTTRYSHTVAIPPALLIAIACDATSFVTVSSQITVSPADPRNVRTIDSRDYRRFLKEQPPGRKRRHIARTPPDRETDPTGRQRPLQSGSRRRNPPGEQACVQACLQAWAPPESYPALYSNKTSTRGCDGGHTPLRPFSCNLCLKETGLAR